jgi:hypothetical protein
MPSFGYLFISVCLVFSICLQHVTAEPKYQTLLARKSVLPKIPWNSNQKSVASGWIDQVKQVAQSKTVPGSHPLLHQVMAQVDRTYVLCKDCQNVPFSTTNTTFLIDALQFDSVALPTRDVIFRKPEDFITPHSRDITFLHLAVVAHAWTRGFSPILVLEDDLVTQYPLKVPPTELEHIIGDNPGALVRLTYRYNELFLPPAADGCPHACKYDVYTPHSLSIPEGCLLASAAGYIISRPLFEQFLAANPAWCIDLLPFAQFPQILFAPAPLAQAHKWHAFLKDDKIYRNYCSRRN